jgi:hypothetical protein
VLQDLLDEGRWCAEGAEETAGTRRVEQREEDVLSACAVEALLTGSVPGVPHRLAGLIGQWKRIHRRTVAKDRLAGVLYGAEEPQPALVVW